MKVLRKLHGASVLLWAICWITCGVPLRAEETLPPAGAPADADKASISVSGEGEKIILEAAGADLVDIIRMLADQAGMNVVLDPDVAGRVTASFKNITVGQALVSILESNGYATQERGSVTRVLKADLVAAAVLSKQIRTRAVPVAELQEQLLQFLSPQGKIIFHLATNSFVVIDRPEVVANVESFVASVDFRERQVTIKVQLVEVSLDKRDQFGFKWDWLDTNMLSIHGISGSIGQDQLLPPDSGGFRVSLGNQHFTSIFEALQTNEYMDLLSAPSITTVNNMEAKVEITEDIPYIESTTSIEAAAAGGSTTSTESVEFITVGVKLTVLPQIGDDDYIRMKVSPEVSEAPTRFAGIPVVKRRKAETTLLVKSGQTIVLGGLIRENVSDVETRVPILSSIPLIGGLFRNKDKRIIKVELLIFITPEIIDTDLAALEAEQGRERILRKKEGFR